ncbi:MAG: glucose-6-phosphate isomerase family protein [Halobacteriota archaeon]
MQIVMEFWGKEFTAGIRWVEDLLPVLAYPQSVKDNFKAYLMFRDVYKNEYDHKKIISNNLRYDITVIPPAKVGEEFIKTYGHYHPVAEGNQSYTEIYEVLEGEAFYLLQKLENGQVADFVVVEATKGDKVIIPPNYGHVTVNPSNKKLRMSNWVYRNFESLYEAYKSMRGACYYYATSGWIENEMYKDTPPLRFVKPVIPEELDLNKKEDMYGLIEDPEALEFLWRPSEHQELFEEVFEDLNN